MCNMLPLPPTPPLTFFMAWIFRLEKPREDHRNLCDSRWSHGRDPCPPVILLPWTNVIRVHHPRPSDTPSPSNQADHLKGAIMINAACFCWASFYILQAVTLNKYPAQLSLTTLICMMGAFQGIVTTPVVIEKGKTGIRSIKWDTKLFATLYIGIDRSAATYYISGLVMKERGPSFVTAFNPLGMVIVVIVSSFTLGEQMNLGSCWSDCHCYLYLIIWGKSKDPSLSDSRNEEVEMLNDEEMSPGKNVSKSKVDDGIVGEEVDGEALV
ncbi:hypothetical protein OSB04_018611 [Centaurea solstitialis]|uniref:WAT1-related protein n=1 Tax=Centaurea solstitialis TaxID=347529 RepID=A0AA38TIE0_9ASTR|nr:hypothetical protein OSB04_018611 [Centaurea solstitialis]